MSAMPLPVHHTLSGRNTPAEPDVGAVSLSVHDTGGGAGRPPVVLCHGFPDLAHTWTNQLSAIADAGFRVVAPDQRGFGGSSAPQPISAYSLEHLCGDLADLLDALDIERAVFVGHDWGGFVAWAMPALFPERCAGVVGVCTPYTPFPTTDFLRAMFGEDPETMYMLWFQEPGVAEAVLDPRARQVFEKLTVGGMDPEVLAAAGVGRRSGATFNPFIDLDAVPDGAEHLLSAEELDHYGAVFERTGFRGGINWYRNIDANAAAHPEVGTMQLSLPTLMICAEWDPALPPALAATMGDRCSDLEMHTIAKAGHWVQRECPEELNDLLVDWLTRRF